MIVSGTVGEAINFAPSTTEEEIVQNIRTLLTTAVFSVPLERRLGVAWNLVDSPLNEDIEASYREDIFNQIRLYEPRVEVVSIDFKYMPAESKVVPIVEFKIKEGAA